MDYGVDIIEIELTLDFDLNVTVLLTWAQYDCEL